MNKNVETFIGCDSEYSEADIVLFGAPFDSTTSFRPGARFGSAAIRHESFGIETYSPYQDKDLLDKKVFGCGDLELSFGLPEAALGDIEEQEADAQHSCHGQDRHDQYQIFLLHASSFSPALLRP